MLGSASHKLMKTGLKYQHLLKKLKLLNAEEVDQKGVKISPNC
jgi:hypothetical protein